MTEAAPLPLSQRAMAARPAPYLEGLNPAQRQAVETLDGPVLMLAGAGTGKTRALTARIAHLLFQGKARGNEILAVTFTNKAAREMKNRVGDLLGAAVEGLPWMGTFHSIGVKLLRRHAELVGLKSNFTILDTDDQIRLLKQLVIAANIDEKRWPARLLAGLIDGWKNRAWTPEQVPSSEAPQFDNKGTELYAAYQARLRALNACDFGDLLLHCVTIFLQHRDVLEQYQKWFRYVLVDEYQDTNVAQYLWLRLLAQKHRNICCVGDDDQSIYGWRGAEVGNILRFEKDFPGAVVIRLEQNYRSTPHILAAASGVIRGNSGRLGKTLWTEATGGETVRLIGHWDGEEEARWIGEDIEALARGTSPYSKRRANVRSKSQQQESDRLAKGGRRSANPAGDIHEIELLRAESLSEHGIGNHPLPERYALDEITILVRAAHQMRAFEDRFLTIGLPYRVVGGPRFYERQEIRDAMAYFRLAVSPEDDLAFERVVNTPKRGLGDKAIQMIQIEARAAGTSLLEGARALLARGGIGGKGAGQLRQFVEAVDRWNCFIVNKDNPVEITRYQNRIEEHLAKLQQILTKITEIEATRPAKTESNDDDRVIEDAEVAGTHATLTGLQQDATQLRSRIEVDKDSLDILNGNHVRLAEVILEESGYTSMWQNDKTPEAPGRLENLKELVKGLENHDNLQGFLEHVALVLDNDSDDRTEKVTIMTLHAAKGLEFPVVFLPGWEDGLFPSQRSMDESGQKGLEEERRLAYVGITRAEELCIISFAANRRVYGQWQSQLPSRFIDELPEAHVEVLTPPGLYGGGYGAAAPRHSGIEDRAMKADVYNSPGWQRMQARGGGRTQPPRVTIPDAEILPDHEGGARVFHQKFGYGTVQAQDGDKLVVAFDKAGIKHVLASYVVTAARADDVPF